MSIPFAIRDDDLSYYTDLKELKKLYDPLLDRGFKVSFATIPNEKYTCHKGDRNKFYQLEEYKTIDANQEIMQYIKSQLAEEKIEIMLHGYSHEYRVVNNHFIAECIHKAEKHLHSDLLQGKRYLEDLFNQSIVSFVPPSNQIGGKGVKVLGNIGIKYLSGTVNPLFNRPYNLSSIGSWVIYMMYYIKYKHRYANTLSNGYTQELTYYVLTPQIELEQLKQDFHFCLKHNTPFVLATHHWELFENSFMKETFVKFIDYVDGFDVKKKMFKELFI